MLLATPETTREDAAHGDRLAALVARAFPLIPLGRRRLELSGGDHVLLIVDDRIAFRFPRAGVRGLGLEIEVLRLLQGRSAVATPAYRYVDPDGRFAGYPLIRGAALTPARLAALPPAGQDELLETAALFLRALHCLPADAIAPPDRWPRPWTPAQYADRGLTKYLPVLAQRLPAQAARIEAFYARHHGMAVPSACIIHGDLVAEHILIDQESGRLTGIIDFGDVGLGDPAQDFLGFWAYGAEAARRAVARYDPAATDPGLLDRSRGHFVRYRLDRLFERIGDASFDPAHAAAEIDALLAVTPFHATTPQEMTMDDPKTGQAQPTAAGIAAHATNQARTALDQAAGTTSSVKDAAGAATAQVKDQATSLVGQVKGKALAAVDEQKEGIAGRIDDLASAVHKSGEQFAGQQDWLASAIERGATELGALASSLRENDLASLVGQVKTLARRQPALFVGASLAAGFAVARLGKLVAADVSRDDLPSIPEVGHGGH